MRTKYERKKYVKIKLLEKTKRKKERKKKETHTDRGVAL
jgi:hypothetical protein